MNSMVDGLEHDFKALAGPHGKVDWTTERGYILQAFQDDWKLSNATPISLRNAVLNIAKTGISISKLEGRAHLETHSTNLNKGTNKAAEWRTDASLKIDYKGVILSLVDCGAVSWMRADVVREGDDFTYNGPAAKPIHKVPNPFAASRQKILGGYAMAKLPDGEILCELLIPDDIAAIKKAAGKTSGPWTEFEAEMIKKSSLNRLSKTVPRAIGSRADHIINATIEGDAPDFEFSQEEAPVYKPSYSEDQHKEFHEAIENKDGYALITMTSNMEDKVKIDLFNSFPEGKIVAGKDTVRKLVSDAHTEIKAAHTELVNRMEADDAPGALEILAETEWRFVEPHADDALTTWIEKLETTND